MSVTNIEVGYFTMLAEALKAGKEAGDKHDLNDWYPCGNAVLMIKPRNSKFAKWLVKEELGESDAHFKSIKIRCPIHEYGQSMTPRLIWATAAARYLCDRNINAWVWSYID